MEFKFQPHVYCTKMATIKECMLLFSSTKAGIRVKAEMFISFDVIYSLKM